MSSADRKPAVSRDFMARALSADQIGKMSKSRMLCVAGFDRKLRIAPCDLVASIPKIERCRPSSDVLCLRVGGKVALEPLDQAEMSAFCDARFEVFGEGEGGLVLLELLLKL